MLSKKTLGFLLKITIVVFALYFLYQQLTSKKAIEGFDMPILVSFGVDDFWIYTDLEWKYMNLGKIDLNDFFIFDRLFLMNTKKVK